ncbi:DUF4253 domain-containing protein [Nocardia sp. NPDC059228]|uniref:DUF4253 domain-containing protein n=1 Tax=Nocardia sp. NPDC059228 TaxID=3346777 RepID=UPI003699536E
MLNSIGVPPFRADGDAADAVAMLVGEEDPTGLLAALGVQVPPLTPAGRTVAGRAIWVGEVETGYPAADAWERVRGAYSRTGLWPVLIEERTLEGLENFDPDDRGIELAEPDGRAWLERAWAQVVTEGVDSIPRSPRVLTAADLDHDGFGWADAWAVLDDDTEYLALVPAPQPWLVPHLLNWWGACNYDLDGSDHAAMLRRWAGHWGAELMGMGLGTIALRVGNPPQNDEEALAVSLERFLYCSDQVHQGVGTLDELKPHAAAPLWWFWWD